MQRAATCSLVHVKFANTSSFSTIPGNGINVKIDKLASELFLQVAKQLIPRETVKR